MTFGLDVLDIDEYSSNYNFLFISAPCRQNFYIPNPPLQGGREGGRVGGERRLQKGCLCGPQMAYPGAIFDTGADLEGQNTGYIYSSQDLFSVVFTGAKNGKHTKITVAGYYEGEA